MPSRLRALARVGRASTSVSPLLGRLSFPRRTVYLSFLVQLKHPFGGMCDREREGGGGAKIIKKITSCAHSYIQTGTRQ